MRLISARLVLLLALLIGIVCRGTYSADSILTGRVIEAAVHGHGASNNSKNRDWGQRDIWWTYCISTTAKSYSVISRQSPAKSGLLDNRAVRFSVKKNQILLIDPSGAQISLRIERTGEAGKCP